MSQGEIPDGVGDVRSPRVTLLISNAHSFLPENSRALRLVLNCTYIWKATICALIDLWLIKVDEDPRVTKRSTTTITHNGSLLGPSDGLLVNEVDGGLGGRLCSS